MILLFKELEKKALNLLTQPNLFYLLWLYSYLDGYTAKDHLIPFCPSPSVLLFWLLIARGTHRHRHNDPRHRAALELRQPADRPLASPWLQHTGQSNRKRILSLPSPASFVLPSRAIISQTRCTVI